VAVKGFYDDVEEIEDSAKEAIAEIPRYGAARARELWVSRDPKDTVRLEEVMYEPALNVRRLAAGNPRGQDESTIASSASASLEIRLAKGMDHRAVLDQIVEHFRGQGFLVVESEPSEAVRMEYPRIVRVTRRPGHNAVRTSMDLPIAKRAVAALEASRGRVIKLPATGTDLPLDALDEVLGAPIIIVPIADPDDRRHGPNENIRLQSLWDGIETMAALLAMDDGMEEGAE